MSAACSAQACDLCALMPFSSTRVRVCARRANAIAAGLVAIDIEPQSPTAHYNLACFLATHAHDLAVREYKETIAAE
jgi:hypothetical protein